MKYLTHKKRFDMVDGKYEVRWEKRDWLEWIEVPFLIIAFGGAIYLLVAGAYGLLT